MVRVSTIILFVLFVLSVGYSLVLIVVPTIVLEGDFQAITGKSYEEFLSAEAVRVSVVHIRHMQVFDITAIVAAFFILFAGFRKAETWAWWAMLVIGAVSLGFGTVLNVLIGNKLDSAVFLVASAVFLVALFLPIRKFMARSS